MERSRPKPLLTSVMARCVLRWWVSSVDVRGWTSLPGHRSVVRPACRAGPRPGRPALSLLSGYDELSDALWRVGSLGGPCGSWRGRQQEQGQGVAEPVLVAVGAPSSMAGEFGICVGIGESTVGDRGVCGAHSFAEESVVEQHGNVGGLVTVATLTVSGDEFGQGGVGGAGVSQDAMCERRALQDAS